MSKKAYLSCLSFGDLIIELNFLIRNKHIKLLTPTYNKILIDSLQINIDVEYFDYNTDEIPPLFFNFKSKKFIGIAKSFFKLLIIIFKLNKKYDIIFYENSLKWKILNLFKNFMFFKKNDQNIYGALIEKGYYNPKIKFQQKVNPIISIFPDSRQPEKSIPNELLTNISNLLESKKLAFKIYTNRKKINGLKFYYLNSLKKLNIIISCSDGCITADSMPLHLAAYNKINSFVFANKLNSMLFPIDVIEQSRWSNFSNLSSFVNWIDKLKK